ncbi:hypothetical protein ACOBR4_02130 [Gardnerella piotii]|uniref:hypothetical protein n=1 Tax=Gardnerella piotii TaxID=2792977 RepID=UPI003D084DCF
MRACPNISWIGHLTSNPAYKTQNNSENYVISVVSEEDSVIKLDLDIKLDTFWDNLSGNDSSANDSSKNENSNKNHAVRNIVIPLIVDANRAGGVPVVDRERLPKHVYKMLAATAGIGNVAITGDALSEMPKVDESWLGRRLCRVSFWASSDNTHNSQCARRNAFSSRNRAICDSRTQLQFSAAKACCTIRSCRGIARI